MFLKSRKPLLAAALFAVLSASSFCSSASVVFDNVSAALTNTPGAGLASTSSTPNTFMGDAFRLAADTVVITGFDIFPTNTSGQNFSGLQVTVSIWDKVNKSSVNPSSPAFSDLLGTYTFTSAPKSFDTGFYYKLEGTTPGAVPYFALPTALLLSDTEIGISVNIKGTKDGINYSNYNSLTSSITYGVAPTVGTDLINGYYRNANGEINGNFVSAARSLGLTNQGLGIRIYGSDTLPVPEPETYAMLLAGLGLIGVSARRKQRRQTGCARL